MVRLCGAIVACFLLGKSMFAAVIPNSRAILWDKTTIRICWEKESDPVLASFKTAGQEIIEAQYNARTVLQFVGFATCQEKNEDIRVRLAVSGDISRAKAYGRQIRNLKDGIRMFVSPYSTLEAPDQRTGVMRRFKGGFLHEVGHAVGLLHEQAHPDTTCSFYRETLPKNLFVPVGAYDEYSVMDYCHLEKKIFLDIAPTELSAGDVTSLQRLYGDTNPVVSPAPEDLGEKCEKHGGTWHITCCNHDSKILEALVPQIQCAPREVEAREILCREARGKWWEKGACCYDSLLSNLLANSSFGIGFLCEKMYYGVETCVKQGGTFLYEKNCCEVAGYVPNKCLR